MRRLLSIERHQKILERVASEGAVDFISLAEELGVSSMTVRRDVRVLEENGHITTTRGGASAQVTNSQRYSHTLGHKIRALLNHRLDNLQHR